jgi:hypothetical protein
MWRPDSDVVPLKVKTFRDIDLLDPKFQSRMIFGSVELLRRSITAYS